MKNLKLLPVAAFCFLTALLISSCSIFKTNDFADQKYTHFKKGKTTVNLPNADRQKNNQILLSKVSDQKKSTDVAAISSNKTLNAATAPTPENTYKSGTTEKQNILTAKENTKVKIAKASSFVKSRLKNKANLAASNDDGLSLFWVIILILLIFWAIGLASGGFGMGGLINVLLVIALILLILWLLQVV